MIYLSTFLYYVCFASTALVYGIGLNRVADIDYYSDKKLIYFVKIVISIFISSVISEFFVSKLLVPLELVEIYPIICILVFGIINTLLEGIFRVSTGFSYTEFILSFIVVILSVSESHSIINTIVISGSCLISLGLVIPVVMAFRKRIIDNDKNQEKYLSRFFFLIAILILILSVFDITWLNPEVIQ